MWIDLITGRNERRRDNMNLEEFIANRDVEFTRNTISIEDVKNVEAKLGNTFGEELKDYALKYGYLAYKHIELYGLNSKQMLESDMVKQTQYLHEYFMKTLDYIALENCGDGCYAVISSDDHVYKYYSELDEMRDTELKLFDYILGRFLEID